MKYCTHFDCVNGKIYDGSSSKFVDCPLCAEIRMKKVTEGAVNENDEVKSMSEILGFRRIFTKVGLSLGSNYTKVLGSVHSELEHDLSTGLENSLDSIIQSLSVGKPLKSSFLIYLGSTSDIELYGYLLLASAYKAGLTVHPFVTPYRLSLIRKGTEEYDSLVSSQVLVATFSPSIRDDAYLIEDLVRTRAYEGNSTILLLSDGVGINSVIQRLCSDEGFSQRQCLYIGIPKFTNDEFRPIKKVNKVIRNSNNYLKMSMPELEVDLESPPKAKDKGKVPRVSSLDDIYSSKFT